MIDMSDRNAIRQLCKLMHLIFRDDWFESEHFITILPWKRRFWFKEEAGIEYISEIEEFK